MNPTIAPIAPGDLLLAALSGGADSTAMTHWFCTHGFSVAAVHFNHHLQGEESNRDEALVRRFCEAQQVRLFVEEANVMDEAKRQKRGIEETGRDLRYAFFDRVAKELEAAGGRRVWILTAHTADDQAETVLFRLVRGSAVRGLCGIPAQRGRILRPLLTVTRAETVRYCAEHGLEVTHDSGNRDRSYARNRLRLDLLPALEQVHGGAKRHLVQAAQLFAEEEDYLAQQTALAMQTVRRGAGLSAEALRNLPAVLRRRVLVQYLEEQGAPVSFAQIERLLSWLSRDFAREEIGAFRYELRQGQFSAERMTLAADFAPIALTKEGEICLPGGKKGRIQILDTSVTADVHNYTFSVEWDCAKIKGVPTLRRRMPGDRFCPPYRACTKTLKKLFSEAGLSLSERETRLVLADDDGVFAVEGFGVDNRVQCDSQTERRMLFGVCKEKEGT